MTPRTRRVWRRFRSAVTGRFVTKRRAVEHPDTTIAETRYIYTDDQRHGDETTDDKEQ